MLTTKELVRAADHLRSVMTVEPRRAHHNERQALLRWKSSEQGLRVARRRLRKAQSHGLALIQSQLKADVRCQLESVRDAVNDLMGHLTAEPRESPSLSFLVAELRQLEEEFSSLKVHWSEKWLGVSTESIRLRDVYLGPFSIRLFWSRLERSKDVHAFDVVALDPNPADSNESVTHPHVCDEQLCPGRASLPLANALVQGRIADAFCLIRSVLTHYNSESPHVSLDAWSGRECHDCCGSLPGDSYYCEDCGYDYCADCTTNCAKCEATSCRDCLTGCFVCQERYCSNCVTLTSSQHRCCAACIEPCARCKKPFAKTELSPRKRYCADCGRRRPKKETLQSEDHDEQTSGALETAEA